MMASSARNTEDRVFVRDGRRHYRRRYSMTEVWLGMGVLGILALVLVWVAWKGARPDPELYRASAPGQAGAAPVVDRAPLPEGLAGEGWTEGPVARFDASTLYEKINGREGYYKGFGFQELVFVSLSRDGSPSTTIDIELFDQGNAANALGAYAGEMGEGTVSTEDPGGRSHIDRNALFLQRGPYYIRVIGSDESSPVRAELARLRDAFREGIGGGEELPPPFRVFTEGLGMDPGRVAYTPENAFSFGFAKDVYSAYLDDDETEIFVVPVSGPAEAEGLAARFVEGFQQYGEREGDWVRDRYLGTVSGVRAADTWVVGVRGAPDQDAAAAALESLESAVGLNSDPEPYR